MGPRPPSSDLDSTALAARCRAAGVKVTPQRIAVLRAVLSVESHPSPEEVFKAVRLDEPVISLATVYKALDALERAGLISQVALLHESKRYDGNIDPHHHLICTSCRSIRDITDPQLDAVEPPKGLRGFVATGVKVQILGLCEHCKDMGTT